MPEVLSQGEEQLKRGHGVGITGDGRDLATLLVCLEVDEQGAALHPVGFNLRQPENVAGDVW